MLGTAALRTKVRERLAQWPASNQRASCSAGRACICCTHQRDVSSLNSSAPFAVRYRFLALSPPPSSAIAAATS
jgi:hypothetical protein